MPGQFLPVDAKLVVPQITNQTVHGFKGSGFKGSRVKRFRVYQKFEPLIREF
jgi:hypothetical protein